MQSTQQGHSAWGDCLRLEVLSRGRVGTQARQDLNPQCAPGFVCCGRNSCHRSLVRMRETTSSASHIVSPRRGCRRRSRPGAGREGLISRARVRYRRSVVPSIRPVERAGVGSPEAACARRADHVARADSAGDQPDLPRAGEAEDRQDRKTARLSNRWAVHPPPLSDTAALRPICYAVGALCTGAA